MGYIGIGYSGTGMGYNGTLVWSTVVHWCGVQWYVGIG